MSSSMPSPTHPADEHVLGNIDINQARDSR